MNAKEYLIQVRTARAEILTLEERIDDLRYLAGGVGGIDYAKPIIKTSAPPSGARLAAHVDHISPLITELNEKEKYYAELVRTVEGTIDRVRDPRLRALLKGRYLCFYSIDTLSRKLHYSESHVKKLHKTALREIDRILAEYDTQ